MIDVKTPIVREAEITTSRFVMLDLSNCPRDGDSMGKMYLPDSLQLKWRNDQLVVCAAYGRVLRADGLEWLDGRRSGRSYLTPGNKPVFVDDIPDWVRALAERYA